MIQSLFFPDWFWRLVRVLPGLVLFLAAGCKSAREDLAEHVQKTQYFRPVNFNGEPQLPATLHGGRFAYPFVF